LQILGFDFDGFLTGEGYWDVVVWFWKKLFEKKVFEKLVEWKSRLLLHSQTKRGCLKRFKVLGIKLLR
jgi:hypothetical protein